MTDLQTRRDLARHARQERDRGGWLLPSPPRGGVSIFLRGVASAAMAVAVVVSLRLNGMLTGGWAIALLLACLLALPLARTFAARTALSLSILLGVVPLLWWVPSGFGPLGRGTFILAAAAGVVAFAVGLNGIRRIIPQCQLLDAVPLLAAGLSVWGHFSLLSVQSYDKALSLLTMNWDNASHFDIFHMLRLSGRVIPLLGPAPDGSEWSFQDYPQGFHGMVAIIAELSVSKTAGTPAQELVTFANGSALVSVLVSAMVLAALSALPAFRRRPLVAVPVLTLVAAGWIFGPGASASLHGFANFFLAVGLASVAIVIAASADRPLRPAVLLALASCVVGVAHNWVLLEVLLVGALVMVLLPWDRQRWRATKATYVAAAAIACLGALGVVLALTQLAGVSTDAVLYGVGGVPIPDLGQLALIVFATAALATLVLSRSSRLSGAHLQRLRWSFSGLAAGLVLATVMAAAQLAKGGALTYYSHKLGIALFLAGLVSLALLVAAWLETLHRSQASAARRKSPQSGVALTASTLAALAATQAFGFTFPLAAEGLPPTSPSSVAMAKELEVLDAVPRSVEMLIAATNDRAGKPAVYLTTRPTEIDAILAKQWYDGLTGTYTEAGWQLSLNMFELSGGVDNLRLVVNKIVKADPDVQIIVDPDNQAALNHILATLDN